MQEHVHLGDSLMQCCSHYNSVDVDFNAATMETSLLKRCADSAYGADAYTVSCFS